MRYGEKTDMTFLHVSFSIIQKGADFFQNGVDFLEKVNTIFPSGDDILGWHHQ